MTFQPELWHDGWETEADRKAGLDPDEQAFVDLHGPQQSPSGHIRLVQRVDVVLEVL